MNTPKRSVGRRLVAALGVAALSLAGAIGISATASAAAAGPGQDGAPTVGSLTIHKYAGTATSTTPPDGSLQTPSPDRPALAGVVFKIQNVISIDGAPVDLTTPEGWDVVSANSSSTPTVDKLSLGSTIATVTTGADGSVKAANLPIGLYYVTEQNSGPNEITGPSVPFLVTIPLPQGSNGWLYDVHVYPKNTVSSEPTKTVDDAAAHKLGDEVSWTVTSPSLSVQPGSSLTSFVVTDNLVAQLEFVADSVTASVISATDATTTPISSADFDDYFSVGYTPAGPGGKLTITATDPAGLAYLNSLPTSDKVSFTFTTKVVGVGELENTAIVNVGGTEKETEPVTTLWGPALIKKHDASTSSALKDAEFSVYVAGADGARPAADASPILTNVKTDDEGRASIDGLKAGEYWVQETKAPAGYVLPEGDSAWSGPITVAAGNTVTEAATVDVANTQQNVPSLPLTGANGQLLALIGGGSLVLLAAGTALVARKRSHQD